MSFTINRFYTRAGDDGRTGLVGGPRILKSSLRINAVGEVDELNAALGVVKETLNEDDELRALIEFLQQELFDLGGQIATPPSAEYGGMWKVAQSHVTNLEELCDFFGTDLEPLTSFILPGGSETVAHLHVARTFARRAERSLVALRESKETDSDIDELVIHYINRFSDLLFNLARWSLKKNGLAAPLWRQEKQRSVPKSFQTTKANS